MLNRLNIFLLVVVLILGGLFFQKILTFKRWDRYYYTASVSNPYTFPIHVFDIQFLDDEELFTSGFYEDLYRINEFQSDWGKGSYYYNDDPRFLPNKLLVEYMDFRTRNYYVDTIAMPVSVMKEVFNEAKNAGHLENKSLGGGKLGLEFRVGIANGGNLVFWLIGNEYEKEFYRTKLEPKVFLNTSSGIRNNKPIKDKSQFIDSLFINMPDSVKRELLELDVSNVNYKDSIPVYFKSL